MAGADVFAAPPPKLNPVPAAGAGTGVVVLASPLAAGGAAKLKPPPVAVFGVFGSFSFSPAGAVAAAEEEEEEPPKEKPPGAGAVVSVVLPSEKEGTAGVLESFPPPSAETAGAGAEVLPALKLNAVGAAEGGLALSAGAGAVEPVTPPPPKLKVGLESAPGAAAPKPPKVGFESVVAEDVLALVDVVVPAAAVFEPLLPKLKDGAAAAAGPGAGAAKPKAGAGAAPPGAGAGAPKEGVDVEEKENAGAGAEAPKAPAAVGAGAGVVDDPPKEKEGAEVPGAGAGVEPNENVIFFFSAKLLV